MVQAEQMKVSFFVELILLETIGLSLTHPQIHIHGGGKEQLTSITI